MAAASAASAVSIYSPSKITAAELLTRIGFVELVYKYIKEATGNIYVSNQVYAYPLRESVEKRHEKHDTLSQRYMLGYHPDDLTIVGGMAFSLYDHAIRDMKDIVTTRKLESLKTYLSKNTSDIDMVWWPRILDNNQRGAREIITVNSPAIKEHAEQFRSRLQIVFQNPQYIESILKHIPDATSLMVEVSQRSTVIAGVIHIHIHFYITYEKNTTITLEIADISIHDGGSSQIVPGPMGSILMPMETDPMHVTQMLFQIKTLHLSRRIKVNVPIMLKLIDQQLLAFSNGLEKRLEKCLINYNRIRYILFILAPRNSYTTALLQLFNIDNPNYIITNTEMALSQIINMRCIHIGTINSGKLCMYLQQLQQQRHADSMLRLQMQMIQNEQRSARNMTRTMAPISAAASSHVSSHVLPPKKCGLPDTFEYMLGKTKIMVKMKDHPKRDEIEASELCDYYYLLDKVTRSNKSRAWKGMDKEQLKRIKIFIHDFINGENKITIDAMIKRERGLIPLKSELENMQGGRRHNTLRKNRRFATLKRH